MLRGSKSAELTRAAASAAACSGRVTSGPQRDQALDHPPPAAQAPAHRSSGSVARWPERIEDDDDEIDIFVTQRYRNDAITVNEFFLYSTDDYDEEDERSVSPEGIQRRKLQKQVRLYICLCLS